MPIPSPPPPPAPPPTFPVENMDKSQLSKSEQQGRNALLSDITKGTRLKKTVTNDRSTPILHRPKRGGAANVGQGELFQGGMPQLRSVGIRNDFGGGRCPFLPPGGRPLGARPTGGCTQPPFSGASSVTKSTTDPPKPRAGLPPSPVPSHPRPNHCGSQSRSLSLISGGRPPSSPPPPPPSPPGRPSGLLHGPGGILKGCQPPLSGPPLLPAPARPPDAQPPPLPLGNKPCIPQDRPVPPPSVNKPSGPLSSRPPICGSPLLPPGRPAPPLLPPTPRSEEHTPRLPQRSMSLNSPVPSPGRSSPLPPMPTERPPPSGRNPPGHLGTLSPPPSSTGRAAGGVKSSPALPLPSLPGAEASWGGHRPLLPGVRPGGGSLPSSPRRMVNGSWNSDHSMADDWEGRFTFHPVTALPPPEPYTPCQKTYPSKMGKGASRGSGIKDRGAPPLPPLSR